MNAPPHINRDSFFLVMKGVEKVPQPLPEGVSYIHSSRSILVPFGGRCHPRDGVFNCHYKGNEFKIPFDDVAELLNHHAERVWSCESAAA